MKNIFFRSAFLVALLCISIQGYAQDPQNLFYIHGFTSSASAMHPIAQEMADRFGWDETPEFPGYSSATPFGFNAYSMFSNSELIQANPQGEYIGVGYSAGGLMTRSIVARHATDPNPQSFITGFVTISTPNAGVWMANPSRRAFFINSYAVNLGRILRGPIGPLAFFASYALQAIEKAAQFVSIFGHAYSGMVQDMDPYSWYYYIMNDLNQPNEQAYGNRRVQVWADVPYPREPAYGDLGGGQRTWGQTLRDARQKSHEYSETANRVQSGKKWYQFWKWFSIWWNRSRAGDWTVTANALVDENWNWEYNTAGITGGDGADRNELVPSDGFIGRWSQRGIPGNVSFRQITGASNVGWQNNTQNDVCNHGGAITWIGYQALFDALGDAGALPN